jgi:hypothetical protein
MKVDKVLQVLYLSSKITCRFSLAFVRSPGLVINPKLRISLVPSFEAHFWLNVLWIEELRCLHHLTLSVPVAASAAPGLTQFRSRPVAGR